jgi:hypothetical protein
MTKEFLITSLRHYYYTGHYGIGRTALRKRTTNQLAFSRIAVKRSVIHRGTIVWLARSLGQGGTSWEPARDYLLTIVGVWPRWVYDSRRLSGEMGNLRILSWEAHLDTHSLWIWTQPFLFLCLFVLFCFSYFCNCVFRHQSRGILHWISCPTTVQVNWELLLPQSSKC